MKYFHLGRAKVQILSLGSYGWHITLAYQVHLR